MLTDLLTLGNTRSMLKVCECGEWRGSCTHGSSSFSLDASDNSAEVESGRVCWTSGTNRQQSVVGSRRKTWRGAYFAFSHPPHCSQVRTWRFQLLCLRIWTAFSDCLRIIGFARLPHRQKAFIRTWLLPTFSASSTVFSRSCFSTNPIWMLRLVTPLSGY